MKIVVLCLGDAYNEGFGYQENLLSKYQKILGNDVYILANRFEMSGNYDKYDVVPLQKYVNKDGIIVKRLEFQYNTTLSRIFHNYKNVYKELEDIQPDMIFSHSIQYLNLADVAKYKKKHPEVVVLADNHADFSNSAMTTATKMFHILVWKRLLKKTSKYIDKFYGVTPGRCSFLTDFYDISKNKVELLTMGIDDQIKIRSVSRIKYIKNRYNPDNKILIVTGGKIDKYKIDTFNLLKAFNKANQPNYKLIVFGSIDEGIRSEFEKCLGKAEYVGWLDQGQIADLLTVSDLAIYPGRHSVLWEETLGCGTPIIIKKQEGMEHLICGKATVFLDDMSEKSIFKALKSLSEDNSLIIKMKQDAEDKGEVKFLYSNIARKTIDEKKKIKDTIYCR